ncbi:MAG: ATP-dependent helicase HrpB [Bryobacteraceae bacterium]|nr:ATP-dependent helicase HrpB [Bryobacteraceae bacterium]
MTQRNPAINLPVNEVLSQILLAIREGDNVIIDAEPGAGKTTRVPPALLSVVPGEVIVLEPRRLPARMAASRVAAELGETLGETVGYQVRFEEISGPRTRLRFLTEGVLTRRLISDPNLERISVVVLDEFHERHVDSDLALALLRRLQTTTRPDLRLVVMSATLDTAEVSSWLSGVVIHAPGRVFDVAVRYAGHSGAPLEEQVATAVNAAVREGCDGHILVFLPGAAEIRRTMRACEGIAKAADLWIAPLYGDLPTEEQDRAVLPSKQLRLILSTNVAESSLTIDGVTTVVDSGLARIAGDSAATGLPTLEVRRISKASAKQRAGRAGRTAPGRAIRLYSQDDFQRRPDYDVPEIRRREMSQVLLELRAMGLRDLAWLEPPPAQALAAASELLDRLGADRFTREMARLPLHPRLSRMLLEAERRGVAGEACRVVAHLSSGDRAEHTDVLEAAHRSSSWRASQIEKQMRRLIRAPREDRGSDEDLRIALLTAFPDRVARRRSGRDVQLANGMPAVLAEDWNSDLLVAVDVEDRRSGPPVIRAASAVEPEWLLDLFPDRIRERNEVTWNRTAERVEAVSALLYDEVVIEENRGAQPQAEAASALLAEKAVEAGLHRWTDVEELTAFRNRVAFAAEYAEAVTPLDDALVEGALRDLCFGLRSFRELESATRAGGLLQAIRSRLGQAAERALNEYAPERIALKHRQVRVTYIPGQPPSIASRLQDFFGMKETPRIARGRVALVVHLLAPNQRPVQMTTDLAGFWARLYPQVRKELSRRYPKHSWPENPG